MVCDPPIYADADASGQPGPELPVSQATVSAAPLVSDVAELNVPGGVTWTRSGGCGAVTVALNPSAENAAEFELVIEKFEALGVFSVIAPPSMLDGVEVPVTWSILVSRVWTLSPVLM